MLLSGWGLKKWRSVLPYEACGWWKTTYLLTLSLVDILYWWCTCEQMRCKTCWTLDRDDTATAAPAGLCHDCQSLCSFLHHTLIIVIISFSFIRSLFHSCRLKSVIDDWLLWMCMTAYSDKTFHIYQFLHFHGSKCHRFQCVQVPVTVSDLHKLNMLHSSLLQSCILSVRHSMSHLGCVLFQLLAMYRNAPIDMKNLQERTLQVTGVWPRPYYPQCRCLCKYLWQRSISLKDKNNSTIKTLHVY